MLVLLVTILAAAAPQAPPSPQRIEAEARAALADVEVLGIFNSLGIDRNQALGLLPVARGLRETIDELDRALADAENTQRNALAAIAAGLAAGQVVTPQGQAVLDRLDALQADNAVRREDALLEALGEALEILNNSQRRMIRDPAEDQATDDQEAFRAAMRFQRDYMVRRATVGLALGALMDQARATVDPQRFAAFAPRECMNVIVATTGASPRSPLALELQAFYLERLNLASRLSPVDYRVRAPLLLGEMADATMLVLAMTQGVGDEPPERIPAERFCEALAYRRTPTLLQHLARERGASAGGELPAE